LQQYPIITRGGNYTMYVRCLDGAGNGEAKAPFLINFQVMALPDGNSPIVLEANPISGSRIMFDTTSKLVSLKLNEPSECKWAEYDMDFDSMNNSFECDTNDNQNSVILGYYCKAILNGITTNMSQQTKFYVRCKDQPWLEGHEDDVYKRNKNSVSYEYILKPSNRLEITELTPIGEIKKSMLNSSIEINVKTSGGSSNGVSECKWSHSNQNLNNITNFIRMSSTNSTMHKQRVTSPFIATNYVYIKCEDMAGNVVYNNSEFNLTIDTSSPSVIRVYWISKTLKIKTDEDSKCYYSTNTSNKCAFNINNASSMSGNSKDHTIEWQNDKNYYIKCADNFGNYAGDCSLEVRTY